MYKPIPSEYYGDNTRWFIATVIDASPPYGFEERVKIRVHGLHTESTRDIPQDALPKHNVYYQQQKVVCQDWVEYHNYNPLH